MMSQSLWTKGQQWVARRHWSKEVSVHARTEIKGERNCIRICPSATLCNLKITIYGNDNQLLICNHCYVEGQIELYGNGNQLTIGSNTVIFRSFLAAHGGKSLMLGEGCLIAYSDLRTTDSHPIFDAEGQRTNADADVWLGDRVWLPRQVSILRGAHIGNDVVIGASALVTGVIPSNSLAVGVPARVVRSGITWRVV